MHGCLRRQTAWEPCEPSKAFIDLPDIARGRLCGRSTAAVLVEA